MARAKKSSDGKPLWMPLYVSDYLADTGRLTASQHGAYLMLMMDYWQNGAPPDNNDVLARIARMSPSVWMTTRPILVKYFVIVDGVWRHSRVDAEYQHAVGLVKKSRDRASAGGRARAEKYGH